MNTSQESPNSSDGLKGNMVAGAAWMTSMRWCIRVIGLINTIILARLLTPDDFGVIAMAMVIVGLVEMFAEVGVEGVLLRQKNLTKQMYDSAWTIQLFLGLLIGAGIFLTAPYIADYYDDERVEVVVQIVAFRALFAGFVNIGVVNFRRNLEFGLEFRFWVYSRVAQFFLAIGLVLYLDSYIGMALSIPLAVLIKVLLSYRMSDHRPRICFVHVQPFWDFAKWIMVNNFASFVRDRGDEFVVGSVAPAKVVGEYYIASDVSTMLTREMLLPTNRAMYPIYNRLKADFAELSKTFHLVLSFAALVAFPVGFGASAVTEDLIEVVLGPQWSEAVPFFQWLAVYGTLAAITLTFRPMMTVQGYEKVHAYVQVAHAAIGLPLLFLAANIGSVLDVAIARTGTMVFFFVVNCALLVRYCGLSPKRILACLWRPITSSGIMFIIVVNVHNTVFVNKFGSLLFDVAIGIASYIFLSVILWLLSKKPDTAEKEVYSWIRGKLNIQ